MPIVEKNPVFTTFAVLANYERIARQRQQKIFSGLVYMLSVFLIGYLGAAFLNRLVSRKAVYRPQSSEIITITSINPIFEKTDTLKKIADNFSGEIIVNHKGECEYGGIGINSDTPQDIVKVLEVYPNMPAAKAGLKPNDLIVAVDGGLMIGPPSHYADQKIRGEPQSKVTLTISRGHESPFDVTLTRQMIHIESGCKGTSIREKSNLQRDKSLKR